MRSLGTAVSTALVQLGAFVLIEGLLFNPRAMMPRDAGGALLVAPLSAVLAAIVGMCAWALAYLLVAVGWPARAHALVRASTWGLPLAAAAGALAARPDVTVFGTGAAVALLLGSVFLLGASAAAQIASFSVQLPMRGADLLACVVVDVLGAAVLTSLADVLGGGFLIAVSFIVLATGMFAVRRMRPVALEGEAAGAGYGSEVPTAIADPSRSAPASAVIPVVVPVVLAGLVCAVYLGQEWAGYASSARGMGPAHLLASVALATVYAVAVYWCWRQVVSVDVLLLAMAVPLTFPLVSIVFNPGDLLVLQIVGRATHLALLCLGWVALLLLGSYGPRLQPAQPLLACLFMAVYGATAAGTEALREHLSTAFFMMVAIAWLLYLVGYFFVKSRRLEAAAQAPGRSFSEALRDACDRLGAQHRLSARETEILPFLVMGLSEGAIGARLLISPKTVNTHRYRIYAKLGVHAHEELVALIEPEVLG